MKAITEVHLTEQDVHKAIKEYIKTHLNLDAMSLRFSTSVRGDYDRGNAEEYVKSVYCECLISDDI